MMINTIRNSSSDESTYVSKSQSDVKVSINSQNHSSGLICPECFLNISEIYGNEFISLFGVFRCPVCSGEIVINKKFEGYHHRDNMEKFEKMAENFDPKENKHAKKLEYLSNKLWSPANPFSSQGEIDPEKRNKIWQDIEITKKNLLNRHDPEGYYKIIFYIKLNRASEDSQIVLRVSKLLRRSDKMYTQNPKELTEAESKEIQEFGGWIDKNGGKQRFFKIIHRILDYYRYPTILNSFGWDTYFPT